MDADPLLLERFFIQESSVMSMWWGSICYLDKLARSESTFVSLSEDFTLATAEAGKWNPYKEFFPTCAAGVIAHDSSRQNALKSNPLKLMVNGLIQDRHNFVTSLEFDGERRRFIEKTLKEYSQNSNTNSGQNAHLKELEIVIPTTCGEAHTYTLPLGLVYEPYDMVGRSCSFLSDVKAKAGPAGIRNLNLAGTPDALETCAQNVLDKAGLQLFYGSLPYPPCQPESDEPPVVREGWYVIHFMSGKCVENYVSDDTESTELYNKLSIAMNSGKAREKWDAFESACEQDDDTLTHTRKKARRFRTT